MQKLTLSITTCNRIEIFKRSFISFLENCYDKDLFQEILIVDDNSESGQLNKMFNFLNERSPITFTLCCKKFNDKWQYKSLNIILQKTSTDYILHLEDDYKFIKKLQKDTIIKALEFSEKTYRCASISLNCIDPNYFKFVVFKEQNFYEWEPSEKYICPVTNILRPGFNLNPGIWNKKKFLEIGNFKLNYNKHVYDYNELHTETDYGIRMLKKGFKHFMLSETYTEYMLPPGGMKSAFFLNQNILYKN